MKDFLKFTLATVTGIILSSIVLFIISMVTLFGIMSASDTETIVKKNSVMMLDLNGTLVERTQEDPLDILSQLLGDGSNTEFIIIYYFLLLNSIIILFPFHLHIVQHRCTFTTAARMLDSGAPKSIRSYIRLQIYRKFQVRISYRRRKRSSC